MKHLIVSKEIAAILKDKGFGEKCLYYYAKGELRPNSQQRETRNRGSDLFRGCDIPDFIATTTTDDMLMNWNSTIWKGTRASKSYCLDAPFYEQVVDWLLVKHQIGINPYIHTDLTWGITFIPDVFKTHVGSGNFTYFTGEQKLTNDYKRFPTKYGAVEFAIEKALNLI